MSKERALELCDQATTEVYRHRDDLAVFALVDAIRELLGDGVLSKNNPDPNRADLDDILVELQRIQSSVDRLREEEANRESFRQGR